MGRGTDPGHASADATKRQQKKKNREVPSQKKAKGHEWPEANRKSSIMDHETEESARKKRGRRTPKSREPTAARNSSKDQQQARHQITAIHKKKRLKKGDAAPKQLKP